jgi:hypothetical protein
MTLIECILLAPKGKWRRKSWKSDKPHQGYLQAGRKGALCRKDGTLTHMSIASIVATDWEILPEEAKP